MNDAIVPCNGCNLCCNFNEQFLAPILTEEEKAIFNNACWQDPDTGSWKMKMKETGGCYFLVQGKCSIYDHRPQFCRSFDCRNLLEQADSFYVRVLIRASEIENE
ncbi:MAG: YkgJ family cysteine cluster protein [Bacteroidetes bacterium]|nr:MAG: YkgJ family cysteine cluster protein [Bacteroidota bacterium]